MKKVRTKFINSLRLIIGVIFSFNLIGCGSLKFFNYQDYSKPRYLQSGLAENRRSDGNTLKIVSYNIYHSKRIDRAIKIIQDNQELSDADILILQEMTPAAVAKIASILKYDYVFYPAVIHPILNADFGNAVLSRWPILDDHKIILPPVRLRARQRIAVGATLDVNGKKVLVYSLHMGVFVEARKRKELVNNIIENLPAETQYCIVAGDFNTFSDEDLMQVREAFSQKNFAYASKGVVRTYRPWYFFNQIKTLDHIFTKGFTPLEDGKIQDKSASDHFPIWAKISF